MKSKTKKILMLISTILIFIIDLSYALNIYLGIIDLESYSDTLSNKSQTILLSLCAFVNLISIICISRNLFANKKKIIILNIIQVLLGNIFNIIFGIFNIIIISIKTTDIDEAKSVRKELPVLEDITKYKWYVYFSVFLFLFIICYTPIISLLPLPNSQAIKISIIVLLYVIQIISLLIPMHSELKRDFIVFKNNFKTYISKMLPGFGIILIAYIISNLSLINIVNNISTNQSIINRWPIYISAFVAIIIAPLTEELMFRGFMKKFLNNNTIFLIASSLIFGALHITVADSLSQLLYIIPYTILGFAFSLNYIKTKNIASNFI